MRSDDTTSAREQQAAREGWDNTKFRRINLGVIGGTGAGKSTLINAVFGEKVAATGIGRPVTKGLHYYQTPDLGLYDFEGSESFQELRGFVHNLKQIYHERIEVNPDDAIHAIWVCVKAGDRRFDTGQEDLLAELSTLQVPIILVLTQTPFRSGVGIAPDIVEFIDHLNSRNLPIYMGKVVPVSARADEFHQLEKFGLSELLETSKQAVDNNDLRTALDNAQVVDGDSKSRTAKAIIGASSAAAAATAAIPIAGADAPVLVAIQAEMMRRLARLYHVEISAHQLAMTLVGMATTLGGRWIVAQLAKFIPGGGSVINAAVASGITAILGMAWAIACERHWRGEINITDLAYSNQLAPLLAGLVKEQAKATRARKL